MKLTIERQNLADLLGKLSGVIERRQAIPILANVHLTASATGLTAKSTDLDIEATAFSPANVEHEGVLTVSLQLMADIAAKVPKGALIEIEQDGYFLNVKAGRFKTKLATMPADDYPVFASNSYSVSFDLAANDMKRLLDKPRFAVSDDESKYYLNGVYLHVMDGQLKAVATDGHRLGLASMVSPVEAMPGVIIPNKTLGEFIKNLTIGDVTVSVSETKIRLQSGTTVIVSKVIDGTFPDYTRVIPAANGNVMNAGASDLKDAANRVSLVADDRVRTVKFVLSDDQLDMIVQGAVGNMAEETIGVSYDGEPLTIGFNAKYLADALQRCNGDDVRIEFGGNMDPVIIRHTDDKGFLAVLMPFRV